MEQLIEKLRVLLGTVVAFKFKAHGYHWNVEGDDFPQYHEFFEEIYEDADGSIDPIAESLRKLNVYAPFKLTRFQELSMLPDTDVTSDAEEMAADLLRANEMIVALLMDTFDVASAARQQGIANLIADRIDMHQKWSWQLRASTKEMSTGE